MKLHAKLEKLDVLEKECLRLTATQKTAEVSFPLPFFLEVMVPRTVSLESNVIGPV